MRVPVIHANANHAIQDYAKIMKTTNYAELLTRNPNMSSEQFI